MTTRIDEWLMVQRAWMYLENIFSAEDIQKQLQVPKNLYHVNRFYRPSQKIEFSFHNARLVLLDGSCPGEKNYDVDHNSVEDRQVGEC